MLILRLTQNNQWIGVDHAARIHLLYIYIYIYIYIYMYIYIHTYMSKVNINTEHLYYQITKCGKIITN